MTARLGLRPTVVGLCLGLVLTMLCGPAGAAVITDDTIKSLVREKIYRGALVERDALSIEFIRVPEKVSVPGTEYRLYVAQHNPESYLGRLAFAVTVLSETGAQKKCWVTAQVSARAKVVVAARPIKAGCPIAPDDVLVKERMLEENLRQRPLMDSGLAVGKVLKRGLSRGKMLTLDMLAEPVIVKKGSVVRLEAHVGALCVSTLGVALSDGRSGEVIPVRNAASKKTVYGTVQSDGIVLVLVKDN